MQKITVGDMQKITLGDMQNVPVAKIEFPILTTDSDRKPENRRSFITVYHLQTSITNIIGPLGPRTHYHITGWLRTSKRKM
jgi:hypothetical protein